MAKQFTIYLFKGGLLWWLSGKEPACNVGDIGSIPGSGRSPGEGNGEPLQYSCHGQRSLAGYSPWGNQRIRQDLVTKQQLFKECYVAIESKQLLIN